MFEVQDEISNISLSIVIAFTHICIPLCSGTASSNLIIDHDRCIQGMCVCMSAQNPITDY